MIQRMRQCFIFSFAALAIGIFALQTSVTSHADDLYVDVSGQVRFESRWFPNRGDWPGQQRRTASGVVFEPKFYFENSKGWSFNLGPFFRFDNMDDERTHAELREAYFLMFGELEDNEWEVRLGIDHVFWGVGEFVNLVDIINQSDTLEDPLGKVKLGQAMAHFTLAGNWGIAELFYMPDHRLRLYPGVNGRLRSSVVVDNRLATYEASAGDNHSDYAFRYSNTIGPADIGISAFHGTSREPSLSPVIKGTDPQEICPPPSVAPKIECVLVPHYDQITQYGLDIGLAAGDALFKIEAIHRNGVSSTSVKMKTDGLFEFDRGEDGQLKRVKDDYSAYLIGAEYTFYGVFDSNRDVTLLGERIYDDRGEKATHTYQDELFIAARLAFNDAGGTEFTTAILKDLDYKSNTLSMEFKRRINDDWSLEIEGIKFLSSDQNDTNQYQTRRDGHINLSLVKGF